MKKQFKLFFRHYGDTEIRIPDEEEHIENLLSGCVMITSRQKGLLTVGFSLYTDENTQSVFVASHNGP